MVISIDVERGACDKASHDEGKSHVVILVAVANKPEVVIFLGGGDELLLNRYAIGGIAEDVESVPATTQGRVAIEPLVMDGTQSTVAAVDAGNNK